MSTTCPNCGAVRHGAAKFCNVCGASLPTAAQSPLPIAPAPIQPTVISSEPPHSGGELVFTNGMRYPLVSPMTLGRDAAQCDVVLANDNLVSRAHAQLDEVNGSWQITDLGSSNGTFVNGKRIAATVSIRPGDQITVGQTTMTLEFPNVLLAAPPPQPVVRRPLPASPAIIPPSPLGIGTPAPAKGWQTWKHPPIAEGYVREISERYMVQKDDIWKKGCAAAALGCFIAPFLVFLPFLTGNDMPARDIRIEDRHTGQIVDVKVLGELMGNINLGDAVAIWGYSRKGMLVMKAAYNYETQMHIKVKKV